MSTFDRVQFGNRLREMRIAAGFMRQIDLADEIGTIVQTISNYEKGIRLPDAEMLSRIVEVLPCNADYLLGFEDKPTYSEAYIIEQTGLSAKATRKLIDFKKRPKTGRYSYGDYLSAFIEDVNFASLADNLIQTAIFVDENNIRKDLSNQLYPDRKENEEAEECDDTGSFFDIMRGKLVGIDDDRKADLLIRALKHEAMDIYGKFFEAQAEETLQQSKRRGLEGKHKLEVVTFDDFIKSRKAAKDGEH